MKKTFTELKEQYPLAFEKYTKWIFKVFNDMNFIYFSKTTFSLSIEREGKKFYPKNNCMKTFIFLNGSNTLDECLQKINN